MNVLVAGATGAIGGRIVPDLQRAGHRVVGGSRRPDGAALAHPEVQWALFDVDQPATMSSALEGIDVLVYLVHRMDGGGELIQRECAAASQVAQAAEAAGAKRIVYLGSVQPRDGSQPSEHIRARALTGDCLRQGKTPVIELQASMIISGESESWRMVRDLAARLPVMVLPAWLKQPTRPVAIQDVVAAVRHAVQTPTASSITDDISGPELLSVRDVLLRTAAQLGHRPLMVSVPVLSPGLSARWIHLVTRADRGIANHLVEGMLCDVRGSWPGYWARMPEHEVVDFDTATREALAECEPVASRGGRWVERLVSAIALEAKDVSTAPS